MRADRPSFTAAWVAGARAIAAVLPEPLRLVTDPYGFAFASPWFDAVEALALRLPSVLCALLPHSGLLGQTVYRLQLRTRVLDDVLGDHVARGGRQLVLLGAGFDSRALRLARMLEGCVVFEVDHPATQAHKRATLAALGGRLGAGSSAAVYVPWDFENRSLGDLPDQLAALGHRCSQPTLTIWEGVTMYLTPAAIEATVAAVHGYSSPGSALAFSYFDRAQLRPRPGWAGLTSLAVSAIGEPFRFGWDPSELGSWLRARGFSLRADESDRELAARLMPTLDPRLLGNRGGHVAVAVVDS